MLTAFILLEIIAIFLPKTPSVRKAVPICMAATHDCVSPQSAASPASKERARAGICSDKGHGEDKSAHGTSADKNSSEGSCRFSDLFRYGSP